MTREMNILILEHDVNDIELLSYELNRSLPNHQLKVAHNEKEFEDALKTYAPDIVLSDYSMPQFDGISAFKRMKEVMPDVPFILVSGTVGEERAVELIKSGINDYVLKDKLFLLPARILRALNEAAALVKKKQAEEEVRLLNLTLEERVKERTKELVEANTALEAFSYSVSHDLRSPLRNVLGFAKIISREHGPSITGDLRQLLEHIENSSKRMNAIIEDLLSLAKYGKERLHISRVNTQGLVNSVWDNVLFATQHEAVVTIKPLPEVHADGSMLEQVLVNLISNAVKYSAKKEKPEIEVGCTVQHDEYTFYIKDNGAGFDMQNYDRLFASFQRLHSPSEFEGTGIGLTLVKRIIEKHGGKVWAQGRVNEGATFYFSLPRLHANSNTGGHLPDSSARQSSGG